MRLENKVYNSIDSLSHEIKTAYGTLYHLDDEKKRKKVLKITNRLMIRLKELKG